MQDYLTRLTPAIESGVFPDVEGNPRYGNYQVDHLALA